jgi:hypothetical protein
LIKSFEKYAEYSSIQNLTKIEIESVINVFKHRHNVYEMINVQTNINRNDLIKKINHQFLKLHSDKNNCSMANEAFIILDNIKDKIKNGT